MCFLGVFLFLFFVGVSVFRASARFFFLSFFSFRRPTTPKRGISALVQWARVPLDLTVTSPCCVVLFENRSCTCNDCTRSRRQEEGKGGRGNRTAGVLPIDIAMVNRASNGRALSPRGEGGGRPSRGVGPHVTEHHPPPPTPPTPKSHLPVSQSEQPADERAEGGGEDQKSAPSSWRP